MTAIAYKLQPINRNKIIARLLLGSASWLVLNVSAQAACSISGGAATISSPCTDAFVGGSPYTGYDPAIYNNGSLTNNSQIAQTGSNDALTLIYNGNGFYNYAFYNNVNLISTNDSAAALEASAVNGNTGILNLSNSGTITNSGNNYPTISIGNGVSSQSIINAAGAIIENTGAGNQSAMLLRGNITDFTNSGTIRVTNAAGGAGINLDGSQVNNFTNTGLISTVSSNAAIVLNSGANIITLNNFQGISGSGGRALTYSGSLPTNYNVKINAQQYGQLSASNIGSSSTLFGIYSGSNLVGGTYSAILQNIPLSSVSNSSNIGTYMGGTGGYTYQWKLVNGVSANTLDLRVLSSINPSQAFFAASSVGSFSDANATTLPLFEGGTLRLDQNNATYGTNFSVNGASTNTIDQNGKTSTFSGVFSNTAGQTGNLVIANSSSGGKVILSGINSYTGTTTINSGATLVNQGSIVSNTQNNGTFTNASGAGVGGTFLNGSTGSLENRGTIYGAVTNNGVGANFGTFSNTLLNNGLMDNSGLISGAVTNNYLFGNGGTLSNSLTNNNLAYNYAGGIISGQVDNLVSGALFSNQGRVNGAVTNVSGAQIDNSGRVNGSVTNAGVFNHSGTVANSFANSGTLNINGNSSRITGALSGAGTTNINGSFSQEAAISNGVINVNNGGNFYTTSGVTATSAMNIDEGGTVVATSSITAPLNIANGGLLATVGTQTITGNVVNGGGILPLDSSYNVNVTGDYTQTSTGGFVTPIASTTEYSKLISTNGKINAETGSTVLAILDPSLRITPGTVFAGVLQQQTVPTAGTHGNITVQTISDRYTLTGVWNGNNYDLGLGSTYTGALARYTLASISAVQGPTLNTMHQRYAVLNAVMEYDCNKFEKHNFCLSAQARATGFGTQATGSGVFNIAYRPTQQTRIGAFIDYQAAAGNPTTYTPTIAGALNTGSVNYGYDNATFGGYLGFSQSGYNGRILNTGVQAFVSGGYNPGKIQTTRSLIMDKYNADFVDSQPGSGSASLNSYYVRGMAGYGYALTEQATLMPYVGVRYTDVTRGGYMEGYNTIVTQPLVYDSYYERLVTGFGGMMLNGQLTDRFGVLAGLGTELDFSRSASSFSGYSPIPITILNTNQSMTAFGFQHGGSWNGFRPTGNLGAYYDVMPNHRVTLNGYAGQQAWSTRTYTTGLLGYQISF